MIVGFHDETTLFLPSKLPLYTVQTWIYLLKTWRSMALWALEFLFRKAGHAANKRQESCTLMGGNQISFCLFQRILSFDLETVVLLDGFIAYYRHFTQRVTNLHVCKVLEEWTICSDFPTTQKY
jgi:hypothetical protein